MSSWEPPVVGFSFEANRQSGFNNSSNQQINSAGDQDIPALTLTASILSVIAGLVAVVLYARKVFVQKVYPRSAVLDVLWWGLLVSFPGSLNYTICAALQLRNELESYCPVSLVIMELFWVPQLMLEGTFFVFIALVASGRRLPLHWASRAAVTAVSCGLLITIVVFAALSRMPGGIVYGTSLPWCWIPDDDEIPCDNFVSGSGSDRPMSDSTMHSCMDQRNAGVLIGLRLLGGMMWIFISDFVGVISFVYFAYRLRRYVSMGLLAEVKPAVKLRFFYFLYYLVGTIAIVLQRTGVLPAECDEVMKRVQAFLQPSFAGVNAIVLLGSEREWLLSCGSTSSRRALVGQSTEFGYDLYRADHEDSDEDHSHVSSASTFGYGTSTGNTIPKSKAPPAIPPPASGSDVGQLQRQSDLGPGTVLVAGSTRDTENAVEVIGRDSSSCFLGFEPATSSS